MDLRITDRKPESRPLRSYPSGHATLGYSVGVVLAAMIPEKSQVILGPMRLLAR
jgi:acid phosphatase (class A)